MENTKLDELKRIFIFLAGADPNQDITKVKTIDLIYGLDHYGLKMEQSKKEDLKNALLIKATNEDIDFDEFKECFELKKNVNKAKNQEVKAASNQLFFLIHEILGIKNESQRLTKEDIKNIFQIVFNLDEVKLDINENDNTHINQSIYNKSLNKTGFNNNNKSHLNASNVYKKLNRNNKNTPTPHNQEEDEENIFVKKLKDEFNNESINLSEKLITCIDKDEDGEVSVADFEYMMEHYFSLNQI